MSPEMWALVGVAVGAVLATLGQLVAAGMQANHERKRRVHEERLELYARCYRGLRSLLNAAQQYVRQPTAKHYEEYLEKYQSLRDMEVDVALLGDRFVSNGVARYINQLEALYEGHAESWDASFRERYSMHVSKLIGSLRSYMHVMRVDLGTAPRFRKILLPSLNKRFVASRFTVPDEPRQGSE